MSPRAATYIAEAARLHGVPVSDVLSRSRGPAYQARLRVMHALDREGWTCTQIGQALHRDHTTVLYGLGRLAR